MAFSMLVGIDHILIAVEDLGRAMELYRRLGFQVQAGGEHPAAGTHNALLPLADGCYLELIGVRNPELARQLPFGRQVLAALERTNRFAGFALETTDCNGDVQAIRDRRLEIAKAPPGGRVRPDGQQVSWRTAHPENSRLPFLIQDVTSRALRVPPPTEGLGRSTRVGWVDVGTADLQPTITAYTQLLGERAAENKFSLQRGAIRLSQSFSGDEVQMLTLLTDDIGSLAKEWEARGVSFYDEVMRGLGRVLVPKESAGARLSICGRRHG
jgi:catechol 2,3-dioxygenase-like lactoylglutathione lyase family enzyme